MFDNWKRIGEMLHTVHNSLPHIFSLWHHLCRINWVDWWLHSGCLTIMKRWRKELKVSTNYLTPPGIWWLCNNLWFVNVLDPFLQQALNLTISVVWRKSSLATRDYSLLHTSNKSQQCQVTKQPSKQACLLAYSLCSFSFSILCWVC